MLSLESRINFQKVEFRFRAVDEELERSEREIIHSLWHPHCDINNPAHFLSVTIELGVNLTTFWNHICTESTTPLLRAQIRYPISLFCDSRVRLAVLCNGVVR